MLACLVDCLGLLFTRFVRPVATRSHSPFTSEPKPLSWFVLSNQRCSNSAFCVCLQGAPPVTLTCESLVVLSLCPLSPVAYLLSPVSCFLSRCLLSRVVLSPVSCLLSLCLLSPVSCLLSCCLLSVSCFFALRGSDVHVPCAL